MTIANKAQFDRLFFRSCLLVVITMPFNLRVNNLCIVLFSVLWVIGFFFNYDVNRDRNIKLFMIFVSLPLLYVLGIVYSHDISEGLKDLETKVPLLLFPLIFFTSKRFSGKQTYIVLLTFVIACLFACIYCLVHVLYTQGFFVAGFKNLEPWDLINRNLTDPIGLHPLYFSCYLNFSLVILFFNIHEEWEGRKKWMNAVMIGGILLIFFVNLLLLSRMGLLIMGVVLIGFFYSLLKKRFFKLAIWLGLLPVVVGGCLYAFNSTFRYRVQLTFAADAADGSLSQRNQIWQSSLNLFHKNWKFGVGTGDVKHELIKEYSVSHYIGPFYNCHNEYLQTGSAVGILGLVIILISLGAPFLLTKRNVVYFSFLVIVAMGFLTESMLEVQKGVVFYSFFYSFFAFGHNKDVRLEN